MSMRPRPPLKARTGLFKVRLHRKGAPVACLVGQEAHGRYHVVLDGERLQETWEVESAEQLYADCLADGVDAFRHPLLSVWLFGDEIDEETYRYMLRMAGHARDHDPRHPMADPTKPIDRNTMPVSAVL